MADNDDRVGDIDVAPVEPERLTDTHPGHV